VAGDLGGSLCVIPPTKEKVSVWVKNEGFSNDEYAAKQRISIKGYKWK
jgi:hypothetical protein